MNELSKQKIKLHFKKSLSFSFSPRSHVFRELRIQTSFI